ncbi:uncharacterized protein [Miscanthus floridulus]|uniref:uncharacterized protein n=1 Tax=Miscanthus floridulus TaxID=154761 RepID=UPI0034584473
MKILLEGVNDINILYKDAFDKLNMDIRKLHASQSPFHGIIPRQHVMPLSMIDLYVTFNDAGPYNAISGKPCYAKFMAVLNYAYLKLKMPGPCDIITVLENLQSAYQ